jgi:alpha-glucosidase
MAGGEAVASQWYLHLFAPEQPDLNWDNPGIREDFHTTLRFWSDRGVDGFRVDVAHALAKDMSLPLRSKPQLEIRVPDGTDPLFDRNDVHEIFAGWRAVFDEYDPPRAAVAEAWVPFPERQALYALPSGLGQAFNFELLLAGFEAAEFRSTIEKCLAEAAASGASSTWVLSNHDVIRHASRYGLPDGLTLQDREDWLLTDGTTPGLDKVRGLRRARAATLVMLALPGCAYLYQGEELGLFEVADLPAQVLRDPVWLRSGHEQKGRDGCRVPLPWTADGGTYGFNDGSAPAWLPQPEWFAQHAADRQSGAAGSMLEFYRSALAARRVLQADESLTWPGPPERAGDGVLHFARPNGWQLVANLSGAAVELPAEAAGAVVVLSSAPLPPAGLAPDTVLAPGTMLPAETALWLAPAS